MRPLIVLTAALALAYTLAGVYRDVVVATLEPGAEQISRVVRGW